MNDVATSSKPNSGMTPRRDRVHVEVGAYVQFEDLIYKIEYVLDFQSVIGREIESGRTVPLKVQELKSVEGNKPFQLARNLDIAEIVESDWEIAQTRFSAIKPLLESGDQSWKAILAQAEVVGVNAVTLYRWLRRYQAYDQLAALIPHTRGWTPGKMRISEQAQEILEETIKDFYLTLQRHTIEQTIVEIRLRCAKRKVKPPSETTIRKRIHAISERDRLRGRGCAEKARNQFVAKPGNFPTTSYPLEVVQIDHTPLDIIVVDDEYRQPIGRPWLTLAICVDTRMIVGYYLSLDPPSVTSVALCISHAILPKEHWLQYHHVDAKWPVWGFPTKIHVDNGADFRSTDFKKSCAMYGINLEYRPVKRPNFGGHIERLIGTFAKKIHSLPGTTFSNIAERKGYDSEKHAAMTLSELENWLVTSICKVYHTRRHSGIHMPPQKKWDIGIHGNAEKPGIGLRPIPADRESIVLDFLPSFQRTIQNTGVKIDSVFYYDEALRPWINATDNDTGKKLLFTFRRDPRDISVITFFDPVIKQYFRIPYANQARPAMSAWEHHRVLDKLKADGYEDPSDETYLETVADLRQKVEVAKTTAKKAKLQAQKRKEHAKKVSPAAPMGKHFQPELPTDPVDQ